MSWMNHWDIVLLVIATYVAVMTLVRMMLRRRDELVSDVRRQFDARRSKGKKKSKSQKQTRDAA